MSASVFLLLRAIVSHESACAHVSISYVDREVGFHHTFWLHVCRVWELLLFFSSVCANIPRSYGPSWLKVVKVKPGDEQLDTPSHFKSDSTLNKLRGQLLINHYTLTSWIDPKREVQRCRHFIHGSDLKRSRAAGNVSRTVQSALDLLQAGRALCGPHGLAAGCLLFRLFMATIILTRVCRHDAHMTVGKKTHLTFS